MSDYDTLIPFPDTLEGPATIVDVGQVPSRGDDELDSSNPEVGELIIDRSGSAESRSPSHTPIRHRSHSRSYSPHRRSYSRSRSRSQSGSGSGSNSRHRHHKHSSRRHHRQSYSRSYSRSPRRRHRRSYSRSRSRSHSYSPYYSRRRGRSRSRSPMSNRRRHQGNRYNPSPCRVVGVFGLSLYTSEKDIRDVFGRYGNLEHVNIVYDHLTGRSRGFGFVYFEESEDARDAKENCNGLELDGRKIRVDYSITKRAHTPTPGVYMGRPTRSNRDRDRHDDRDSDGHKYRY